MSRFLSGNPQRALALALAAATLAVAGLFLATREAGDRGAAALLDGKLAEGVPDVPDLSGWPPAYIEALREAYEGLSQPGGEAASLERLAKLYHANGFVRQARTGYETLRRLDSSDARWPYYLARLMEDYRDREPVLVYLKEAARLDPAYAPALLKLAEIRYQEGEAAGAAEAYRRQLARDADNAWALMGLGRLAMEAGEDALAERLLDQSVAEKPAFALAYEWLGELRRRRGDEAGAERALKAAAAAPPYREPPDPLMDDLVESCFDAFRLQKLAVAEIEAGDLEAALELLERARAVDPEAPLIEPARAALR